MQGRPLTQVSRPCEYFLALQRSPSARTACRNSWRDFALESRSGSRMFTCYSGLQWLAAPILGRDEPVALFLAGQFYWQPPDPQEEDARLRRLVALHGLPLDELRQAARAIPIIPPEQRAPSPSSLLSSARGSKPGLPRQQPPCAASSTNAADLSSACSASRI